MKITIKNRLSVLLRERGIRSASEFGRRMTEAGFTMSSSHASRFEKEDMPMTDLRFINAACNVLQCLPYEMQDITIELAPDEVLDPHLVIPRHATVLRGGQAAIAQAIPAPTVLAPESKIGAPPAQHQQTSKARGDSKNKTSDPDTGPKVTLFPYGKT